MKKMMYLNITLLSICAVFFILDFFVVESVNKFMFLAPIFVLFIEVGVFLFTFKQMKKSTLKIIRMILGVYCIVAIAIFITIEVYKAVTGYIFIYYGYTPILLALIIYPSILWIMVKIMTLKSMINNRGVIATITTLITLGIMMVNGIVLILGGVKIEIVEKPNEENIVLVTEYAFFHNTTTEYRQKNIFFME